MGILSELFCACWVCCAVVLCTSACMCVCDNLWWWVWRGRSGCGVLRCCLAAACGCWAPTRQNSAAPWSSGVKPPVFPAASSLPSIGSVHEKRVTLRKRIHFMFYMSADQCSGDQIRILYFKLTLINKQLNYMLTSWFLLSRCRCSTSCSSLFCSWEISRSCFSSWLSRRWRVSVSERSRVAWKNTTVNILNHVYFRVWVRNCALVDYLNGLQVGQQQVLALLLAQDCLFFLIQPGLNQLQHVSLLTQALSTALRGRR